MDVRIDDVVLRALQTSPELRWQTAAEMRTGVEAATSSAASRSAEGTASASRWSAPSRWLLLPLVVISGVVCGFVSLALFGHFRYGWLIAGAIAFVLLVVFGLLTKTWQTKLSLPAALVLIGAVLAMPILIAGPLYLALRGQAVAPPARVAGAIPGVVPSQVRTADPNGTAAGRELLKIRVEEAQIRLAAAETRLKRAAELSQKKQISNEEYETANFDLQLARTALRAAQVELRMAEQAPSASGADAPSGYVSIITDGDTVYPKLPVLSGPAALQKRDEARKSLQKSEQTLEALQKRLIEGTISGADYGNAERAVEALRSTVNALEENPNTVTLPSEALRSAGSNAVPAADTAGIGVALKEENGRIIIGQILPNSPAAENTYLKPGVEIRSVGDSGDQLVSIAGWKLGEVVARLRGRAGTQVSLLVVQAGAGTTVALIRRHIPELEPGREPAEAVAALNSAKVALVWGKVRLPPAAGGLAIF